MFSLDYGAISFPSLGIVVDPPRWFDVGPLDIHMYGIMIALGLFLAVVYNCRRCTEYGLTEDDILDGVLLVTPISIICARIYYVAFSWGDFKDDLIRVFYIWEGGIAIYGSVLGAILGMWILCRWKKLKLPAVLDTVSLGFLIGQFMGRWGNFFNREAFGAPTESLFRMGLYNTRTGEWGYYHPTFLYESVWNMIGFVLLHYLSKKRCYDGQIALGYAAWYGLGRAMIEGLRMDSLYWGPFRVSQVLAAVSCLAAAGLLLWNARRPHDPAKMFVNQVKQAKAE